MAAVEGLEDAIAVPEAVVLETKLTRPPARSEHVVRRDLLVVLRSGSHRLTLVAAPPGFGKTTLLAEWAAAEDGPATAWLSVDEDDNDPARFFAYMIEALRRVEPELAGRPARVRALGAWGAVGGGGAAIGVLLGGVLTQIADWRAIFYINLPVALMVALVGHNVVPADRQAPRWRGLDLRGATVATASLAALVYALTEAAAVGWTSTRTLALGLAGLAGLAGFAVLERRAATPFLRIQRLRDRAIGGGFTLMLVASAVMFGTFVTSSLYLQGVLGEGPLATGLDFLPLAVATAAGAHVGAHLVSRVGVRLPMAVAFATAAAGALLLAGVDRSGSYGPDVLPGMIVAGLGLGMVMASIGLSMLGGARDEETGMLSGLNTTGHELGGTLGIAVLVTIATAGAGSGLGAVSATGIDHAFLATGAVAALGSVLASIALPSARSFLPKLQLSPTKMPIH